MLILCLARVEPFKIKTRAAAKVIAISQSLIKINFSE